MQNHNPTYSIVVPIYKDASLADDFCVRFTKVFEEYLSIQDISSDVELIFVSDGGCKDDEIILKEICGKYNFSKAIIFSRNFGQHIALTAGYEKASGKYVGMLNVDQQDPISELPKFLGYIEKHQLDIVYGLREKRKSSIQESLTSKLFNIILNKLTGSETPLNVSTMRVMSRRFIDAYKELKESERYLPGLENWLGFDVGYVPTIHVARKQGKSSYNFKKRLNMAMNSILTFSDYPLRLMAGLGFILSICGFISVIVIAVLKIYFIDFQSGYPSLISAIVLFSGIIIFVVGFSSLYIGKILKEVQNRPVYIVKDLINFKENV